MAFPGELIPPHKAFISAIAKALVNNAAVWASLVCLLDHGQTPKAPAG